MQRGLKCKKEHIHNHGQNAPSSVNLLNSKLHLREAVAK